MNSEKNQNDWLPDIIACPLCGGELAPDSNGTPITLACRNPECGFRGSRREDSCSLLPEELDAQQRAEHDFRAKSIERLAHTFPDMTPGDKETLRILQEVTSYVFTSEFFYFRDIFAKRFKPTGRGLEIGGGTGQQSGFLKLFFPDVEIVFSDVAPINIETARKSAEYLRLSTDYFLTADAERLPFKPESFDFIFSSGMLHHLGDFPAALREGMRVLKPGGTWYAVNELAIGGLFRLYWNSRFGEKGRWARTTGIRENSYKYAEWMTYFSDAGLEIVEVLFHRDPRHKLRSWTRAAYYAFIKRLPIFMLRLFGIPCEINFVLKKPES